MKYITTLIFTLLLVVSSNETSFAGTIVVCKDCAIKKISTAVEKAIAGDLILIKKGHYFETNILIDKPLTLQGENWPILDGNEDEEILVIVADNVTIRGLQIQNVGTSYLKDRAGIRLRKAKNFSITNNRLYNTFFGIYLEHVKNGIIENNEVIGKAVEESSSGNAIHLWYCKNIEVKGNTVKNHRDGIYLEFVDSSTIQRNFSEGNLRYGLHFMFSNFDNYSENTFKDNGAGVAVMFSKKIDMWENDFVHNWGKASFGLLLKEIYDAEIRHNNFSFNTVGIFVEGSTRVNYHHNNFKQNGWAIKISGGCLDNTIETNNFLSNTFDISLSSSTNNNTFNGNYWSSYSGYDLNRDGRGDVPYRPVKLFNYVVNETPEAMVLLRSLFVDIINFSEKVSPIFTPEKVIDERPNMKKFDF
ncbi:MAG: nitrous oxide reductase family maturation protein NosD [Saprospiraceae bacterium]|nr:nitrous oxide reductase family maturation protein NosD [Saprospiraceae bacterium]